MSYQGLQDGLYLLKQASRAKGVDHYGVLDVGNRLRDPKVNYPHPVVIHQTPPSIQMDWLQNTGQWTVVGKIDDEAAALERLRAAFQDPAYDLFGHNCEHFARYVATGRRESTQLQAAVAVAALAVAAIAVFNAKGSGE